MTDGYRRTELPGGLVVLTETMPGIRSASLGGWVRAGSVTEKPEERGISHLLEHMVFKGTARRSPKEIALALERRGGDLDAYTTREHTSYQARVLDEDLPMAMDVLADIVLNPRLDQQDLDLEREVVLEEIAGVEDTPDDLVFELHGEAMWAGHPYGHSILGTRETVSGFDADALRDIHARAYRRPNMVIGAVGNLQHEAFVELAAGLFEQAPNGDSNAAIREPVAAAGASLGGLSLLHAEWEYPGTFGGLFAQSGSFFQLGSDPQEQGYSHFRRIHRFVRDVLHVGGCC